MAVKRGVAHGRSALSAWVQYGSNRGMFPLIVGLGIKSCALSCVGVKFLPPKRAREAALVSQPLVYLVYRRSPILDPQYVLHHDLQRCVGL